MPAYRSAASGRFLRNRSRTFTPAAVWAWRSRPSLNGYPGPAHVIELAAALKLSDEQLVRTRTLFTEMQQKAVPLGNELLSKEAELDHAFASARVDDESLHRILGDIARLQGELRYTHLKYHLAMRGLLS